MAEHSPIPSLPAWFLELLPDWWPDNPEGSTTSAGGTVTGTTGDDTLRDFDHPFDDEFYGLGGDDYFRMMFRPGDVLSGGSGRDVYDLSYLPQGGAPNIVEAASDGIDTVIANHQQWYGDGTSENDRTNLRDFTLADNVENVILGELKLNNTTGPAYNDAVHDFNRWATGNALDNSLIGNDKGDNRLIGRDGNDRLMGNGGNDYLIGGDGQDTAYFRGNFGEYSITSNGGGLYFVNDQVSGRDETDTTEGVEIFKFADLDYFLEANGIGGDDNFTAIQGPAVFAAGGGSDTVSYAGLSGAVNIDLASGLNLGSASNHTFDSVENITGSDTDGDIIRGDAGRNTLIGGGGNDLLAGRAGDDLIGGNAGSDTILGGDGDDILDAGDDADIVYGEAGNDTIVGDSGADYLSGGSGNDFIRGGIEGDVIDGDDGDDMLVGEQGWDHLRGGSGNDIIDAGTGNDILEGGTGNDVLSGEGGADTLTGGAGADIFRFASTDGETDTVTDFEVGTDLILLATGASVADVIASAQVTDGGSTIIDVGGGTHVALIGVTGINASWFVGGALTDQPELAPDSGSDIESDGGILMPETCLIG